MNRGWSLQQPVWNRLAKTLSGAVRKIKWEQVPLDIAHKMSIPPKKSGVYMLCLSPPHCDEYFVNSKAPMFNALYIGSAEDLKRRFTDYANQQNTSSKKVKHFLESYATIMFVYAVCDMSEMKAVEGRLIDSFGPSANGKREGVGAPIPGKVETGYRL